MNREPQAWMFDFGLQDESGDAVPYKTAEELLDVIVAWAEERGLGIGGGFRPSSEEHVPFPLRSS